MDCTLWPTNQLSKCTRQRVTVEKLTVPQRVKQFPRTVWKNDSPLLLCILSQMNPLQVQAVSFLRISPPKVCMHFSSLSHVPPASSISSPLISSLKINLTKELRPVNTVLVEKITAVPSFKHLPALYGNQRLITAVLLAC